MRDGLVFATEAVKTAQFTVVLDAWSTLPSLEKAEDALMAFTLDKRAD